MCQNLIKGMKKLDLISKVEDENREYKCLGFYSNMRQEVIMLDIAGWYDSVTMVSFFIILRRVDS